MSFPQQTPSLSSRSSALSTQPSGGSSPSQSAIDAAAFPQPSLSKSSKYRVSGRYSTTPQVELEPDASQTSPTRGQPSGVSSSVQASPNHGSSSPSCRRGSQALR